MKSFALILAFSCLLVGQVEMRRARTHYVDEKLQKMATAKNATAVRDGKLLTLFNVVTFDNGPCESTASFSGGSGGTRRNGTCYTSSECSDKGGTANGNCAAGFGVCCVFIKDESGDTIDQNCTYIQNENFPATSPDLSNHMYTIDKCDESVCSFRLDFESFTIAGFGDTMEAVDADADGTFDTPYTCPDTFDVTTSTGQNIPTICGQNTGQHIYVDVGRGRSDSVTLQFTFDSALTNTRQWDIKVTQVKCGAQNAPDGCLQYHTGLTGRLTTFNYLPTGDTHLPLQEYSICIRQEDGFCCVQYEVCDDDNAFSIANAIAMAKHGFADCGTQDYVEIAGSGATCQQGNNQYQNNLINYYCQGFLSTVTDAEVHAPICDCTAPFRVGIHTDHLDDVGAVTGNTALPSRGVCLTYMQIPCSG